MRKRQVILPTVFASLDAKPFECLERWMMTRYHLYDCAENLSTYMMGHVLSTDEVENEICDVWMPTFRTKEALNNALCVLMEGYSGCVICDICSYYCRVLNDLEIEVM